MRIRTSALSLLIVLLAAACGSEPVAEDDGVKPEPGKAMIVFLREPKLALQASAPKTSLFLVHADGEGQDFIGILLQGKKIAYNVEPGDHLFMIVGEAADFLEAHMEAGKTYYAVVEKRWGVTRPRYSLWPVSDHPGDQHAVAVSDMAKLRAKCEWLEPGDRDRDWYAENKGSVDHKRAGYLKKWNAREEEGAEHHKLSREDGL